MVLLLEYVSASLLVKYQSCLVFRDGGNSSKPIPWIERDKHWYSISGRGTVCGQDGSKVHI
jgi:hypothetical protein